ncbi:hypothetical protein D5S17_09875 [Pseudonocardiaceae bacterium YIM PH 21723]|nr:hypothetical protein D5S17_09875 [Pseudonocardiaceae bacterium YIM PH 21723]
MTTAIEAPQQVKPAGITTMLPSMIVDAALPTIAYYVAHALGYSDWIALLAGTVVSGVVLVVETARKGRIEQFSALMLALYGLGLLTSFLTGDARFMLAKGVVGVAIAGLAFLVTSFTRRPLFYYSARRFAGLGGEQAGAEFDGAYASNAGMREGIRRLGIIWGAGFLVYVLLKLVLIYTLPVSVMVGLSPFMFGGLMVLLSVFTKFYVARRQRAERSVKGE